MKQIPLTQNQFAIIDDEDYQELNKHKWFCVKSTRHIGAYTKIQGQRVAMHRMVLGLVVGDGLLVDHKNHNQLDNRRENLRLATQSQNQQNRLPLNNTTSKYKGVSWHKNNKKWSSRIKNNGANYLIGYFVSEIEAAKAYDKAAKESFGEFAYLNFQQ